jgi:hypothetical protein
MRKKFNPESIVGQQFNDLKIIKNLGFRAEGKYINNEFGKYLGKKVRYYLCKCINCGAEKEIKIYKLELVCCQKCIISNRDKKKKHPLYNFWYWIIYKNYIKSNGVYKLRSESSDTVCDRWLSNFENFVNDVGSRPSPEYSFTRLNKNEGYSPENFIWRKAIDRKPVSMHINELTISKISNKLGLSYSLIIAFVNKEIKNNRNKLNTYIDRIVHYENHKVIIFKPEALEYFKLQKKHLVKENLKLKIEEYYLKGIDIETAAKELNVSINTIIGNYNLLESNAINCRQRLKDPDSIVGQRIGKILILKNLGTRETGKYLDKRDGKLKILRTR